MEKSRSMNNQRLEQIINAYGSEPDNWPSEERAAALDLLAVSKELQELQGSAKVLDDVLYQDRSNPAFTAEQAALVSHQVSQSLYAKTDKPVFLAGIFGTLQQPRYAVAFSALIAVLVGVFLLTPREPAQTIASPEFDDWMLMQLTGVDSTEEQPLETGFMALVELEVGDDTSI